MEESLHVFINNGLKSINNHKIKILEFGLGTGLNALLSLLKSSKKIKYVSIEKFPLDYTLINQLNYAKTKKEKNLFEKIHSSDRNKKFHF